MSMEYHNGSEVKLGDVVRLSIPGGATNARVVMLGETYDHLDVDKDFVEWVKRDNVLQRTSIVIEWIGANPFAHDDPSYGPVGDYMFTALDEDVVPLPNKSLHSGARTERP